MSGVMLLDNNGVLENIFDSRNALFELALLFASLVVFGVLRKVAEGFCKFERFENFFALCRLESNELFFKFCLFSFVCFFF